MNIFSLLACIGLLAFAGLGGYTLGWLEKKAREEMEEKDDGKQA